MLLTAHVEMETGNSQHSTREESQIKIHLRHSASSVKWLILVSWRRRLCSLISGVTGIIRAFFHSLIGKEKCPHAYFEWTSASPTGTYFCANELIRGDPAKYEHTWHGARPDRSFQFLSYPPVFLALLLSDVDHMLGHSNKLKELWFIGLSLSNSPLPPQPSGQLWYIQSIWKPRWGATCHSCLHVVFTLFVSALSPSTCWPGKLESKHKGHSPESNQGEQRLGWWFVSPTATFTGSLVLAYFGKVVFMGWYASRYWRSKEGDGITQSLVDQGDRARHMQQTNKSNKTINLVHWPVRNSSKPNPT